MLVTLLGILIVAFAFPLWWEDEEVVDEFKSKHEALRVAIFLILKDIEWLKNNAYFCCVLDTNCVD